MKKRRKAGHKEGIRRHRRPGQLALATQNTLRPRAPRCVVCQDRPGGCEFCPRV